MKALVVKQPGELVICDVETPAPVSGEILVRVHQCGLCGTDIGIITGEIGFAKTGQMRYPVRIGHEWAGIVEAVGASDPKQPHDFKPGDRVVSDTAVSCGVCDACVTGRYGDCLRSRAIGTVRDCCDGSFAEYILLPARHVYKLPDAVSLEQGALIEPATIALSGLRTFPMNENTTLLIIGTGAIGLSAVGLAKKMGCGRVIFSGRKDQKLDIARRLGADVCVNAARNDLSAEIERLTHGNGVDFVLETSGNINTIQSALDAVRMRGFISLLGFYDHPVEQFPIDTVVLKSISLSGCGGDYGLVRTVIQYMEDGLDLMPVITHRVSFSNCVETLLHAKENNDEKVKIMVDMTS